MVFSDIAQKAFNGFTLSSSSSSSSSSKNMTTLSTAPDGLTLEMVLQNQTSPPFSLQDFSDYLKLTYCNENLLFYQAVTEYKERCIAYFGLKPDETKLQPVLLSDNSTLFDFSIKSTSNLSTREKLWFETLKNKFEIILQDFILSDAPQEINIPYEIRHQLLQSYQTQQLYHPALLYPACSAVVELLRISAFIPFATDPNRHCPTMKKKKSFKKQKSIPSFSPTTNQQEDCIIPPPLPPLTPTDIIHSASNGFLKRITTSFKIRYPPPPISAPTTTNLDSPPISPPRLSSWRQINIPDLSPFKTTTTATTTATSTATATTATSTATATTATTPTIEKSFATVSVINQSCSLSTTSSSSTSSDISTTINTTHIIKRTTSSSSTTTTKPTCPTTY